MKLKELLKGRDKLRKHDELKEWKAKFENNFIFTPQDGYKVVDGFIATFVPQTLPKNITKIIIDAFDAEIKKLDEE